MTSPRWYYREAIEHALERLGAETWRYQDEHAQFRDDRQAQAGDVELSSNVYGAVLRPAHEILRTLEHLQDGIGDARIAEALMDRASFK